ncbi:MAG: hypothetical protein OXP11_02640, partial [Gammaproteobacteria bacterium]|nr:hypothetical protein [Gammaproteobacteria bacterium]
QVGQALVYHEAPRRANQTPTEALNALPRSANSACRAEPQALRALPEHPPRDQRGLPMEMFYVPCGTARLKH